MEFCRLTDIMEKKELIFPKRAVPIDGVVAFSNTEATYANSAFRARICQTR